MGIFLDLILIGIILLSAYLGYKKGLIGVIFKILSFFIAILITLLLFKPVSNYIIQHTNIAQTIENTIVEKFSTTTITEDGIIISEEQEKFPKVITNYINTLIYNSVSESKDALIKFIAKDLTNNLIQISCILIIFLVTKIILIFAKVIFEAISELPIIKQFNEIGGTIYGILKGILILLILFSILSFVLPMWNSNIILTILNQSILANILYHNNLFLMFFF